MKKIVLIMAIATIGFGIIGCSNNAQPNNNQQNNTQSGTNQSNDATITVEKAKEIALKHAKLTSEKVEFVKADTDLDNGRKVYDIEFYHNNKEYDYEIDAQTGEIVSYDHDLNNQSNNGSNNSTVKIDEQKAKEIALKNANLTENQVKFTKVELDNDNGVQEYDVEFYYNNTEYNYEINAQSGEIISYEKN